jgi:hypothetical protein
MVKSYVFVEFLCADGIKVRGEDCYGLVHSLRGPFLWVCQLDDLAPLVQVGNHLECLGHLAASVCRKNLANLTIHSSDFGVINGLGVDFFQLILQLFLPRLFAHMIISKPQNVQNVNLILIGRLMEVLFRRNEFDIFLLGLLVLFSF